MPTNVIMPALGMAQETGRILKWLKSEGEAVEEGESILEIETDKATVVIEAPASGVLAVVTGRAGDVVPVGQVIGLILAQGENVPESLAAAPILEAPERMRASPKARRLAREQGIDLSSVRGSGPDGAVLGVDLATGVVTEAPAGEEAQAVLSTTWRLMAERTAQAWKTVPHFFLLREADAARLIVWRSEAIQQVDPEVTYTDLLVRIVATTLRDHPALNAQWREGTIAAQGAINVAVAIATDDGLVAPVIHHADRLDLGAVTQRRKDLVARAQSRRLRPDDLQGGTFTISNLGMYGVDAFNAIINAPQAAILAVGRIAPRVVAREDRAVVRPTVMLSLSCDHRVVDGARAARFLSTVAERIENPQELTE